MARRKRIYYPNATYHVMLRGNDGEPIFFSDSDRHKLCQLLQEAIERFHFSLHAFCFMSNHIHFAIRVTDVPLSDIMQNLTLRYVTYINRKHGRTGHLFQGRFKSLLIEDIGYLKELIRYIHLNPVRAGIVNKPDEYPWNSHCAYLTPSEFPWVSAKQILNLFSHDETEGLNRYTQFIHNAIGVEYEIDLQFEHSHGVIGEDTSMSEIPRNVFESQKRQLSLTELVEAICEKYKISSYTLCSMGKNPQVSHARSMLALLVKESKGISITELGNYLHRDASGISKLANRFEMKSNESADLKTEIDELRKRLLQ